MPYGDIKFLPENVRRVLPAHAQAIFMEAYNSAYDEYKDPKERRDDATREEVARKVAWAAVKKKYAKGADEKWHLIK